MMTVGGMPPLQGLAEGQVGEVRDVEEQFARWGWRLGLVWWF